MFYVSWGFVSFSTKYKRGWSGIETDRMNYKTFTDDESGNVLQLQHVSPPSR